MTSTCERTRTILTLLLCVTLLAAPSILAADQAASKAKSDKDAGETAKTSQAPADEETVIEEPPISPIYLAAQEPAPASGPEVVVITNEELERIMAGLPPEQRAQGVYQAERHIGAPAPGSEAQGPTDPLLWMDQRRTATAERSRAIAEAQTKVTDLQAKVKELEQRQLATKNPLLPRRGFDRQNKDVEDWKNLPPSERVKTTDQELQAARTELAAAQQELSRLQASSTDEFVGSDAEKKDAPAEKNPSGATDGGKG